MKERRRKYMGKMAKEEKKIIKDFENLSKEMVPKPKYFKKYFISFSSWWSYMYYRTVYTKYVNKVWYR